MSSLSAAYAAHLDTLQQRSAEALAKKAEAQGNLGKEQAMGQSNVGNPGYLYN